MDSTTYNLLEPDVRTAAKTVARTWPGVIEEDDAEGEIWLRLLEAGLNTLDKLAGMDRPLRVSSLTEMGHQIAAIQRDDYEVFRGNYFYSTDHVRRLLDSDGLSFEGDRPDTLTYTEWLDLAIGMDRLQRKNANYAFLIEEVFVDGVKLESGTQRKELTRAVDALTIEMNRQHAQSVRDFEGPGSRTAVSNNEAARLTREEG